MTSPLTLTAKVVLTGGGVVVLKPLTGQANDGGGIFAPNTYGSGPPVPSIPAVGCPDIKLQLDPTAAALFPQGSTVTLTIAAS